MKVHFKVCFITILFSFTFCVSEAGGIFLLINPGAKAQGTGEAQVARADDAYATYYNPAGLGFTQGGEFVMQHVNWLPNLADDLYYDFIGYRQSLNSTSSIGGNIIYLSLGEQTETNAAGAELGRFKSYMMALNLSYGTMVTKKSSIGMTFKVYHQRLAEHGVSGEGTIGGKDEGASTDFAFDMGYLLKYGKRNQNSFGIAIQNVGPPIDFVDSEQADPAPTNMKLGFMQEIYSSENSKLSFLFDMNKLLVGSYPAMDWNGDGIISGEDELAHKDDWYKGVFTAWLDDWYYGGDYDYDIPSNLDYNPIRTFWKDDPDSYADGIIGGFVASSWNHVTHEVELQIGNEINGTGWAVKQNPNSNVYIPNYNGFCDQTYRAWKGYQEENEVLDWAFAPGDDKSMCYDKDGDNYNPATPDVGIDSNGDEAVYDGHKWLDMPNDGFGDVDVFDVKCGAESQTYGSGLPTYDCTTITANNMPQYDYAGTCDGSTSLFTEEECESDDVNTTDFNGTTWEQGFDGAYGCLDAATNDFNGWTQEQCIGDDITTTDFNGTVWTPGGSVDVNPNLDVHYMGEYGFAEGPYGYYNPYGVIEKGSGDSRSFKNELEEVVYNFGFDYEYSQNFMLRFGFIYDLEGDIKNPTMGAGIKFNQYGIDFGYTAGKSGHPRANTMYFSLSMGLSKDA